MTLVIHLKVEVVSQDPATHCSLVVLYAVQPRSLCSRPAMISRLSGMIQSGTVPQDCPSRFVGFRRRESAPSGNWYVCNQITSVFSCLSVCPRLHGRSLSLSLDLSPRASTGDRSATAAACKARDSIQASLIAKFLPISPYPLFFIHLGSDRTFVRRWVKSRMAAGFATVACCYPLGSEFESDYRYSTLPSLKSYYLRLCNQYN